MADRVQQLCVSSLVESISDFIADGENFPLYVLMEARQEIEALKGEVHRTTTIAFVDAALAYLDEQIKEEQDWGAHALRK